MILREFCYKLHSRLRAGKFKINPFKSEQSERSLDLKTLLLSTLTSIQTKISTFLCPNFMIFTPKRGPQKAMKSSLGMN